MSGDLKTQVRDYTEFFMGTVESIDLEEIKERPFRLDEGPVQPLASPSRNRGWLVALAGAVVVLVLGLLTFLTRPTVPEVPVASRPSPSPTVSTPAPLPSTAIEESASGWSRVPHDETVFGGEGVQLMWGVTAGGPGLVAVGRDGSSAAVWTSVDGIAWTRVPHDESVFSGAGAQRMLSVTVGGPGLVAVGESDSGAAVWTSPDGVTWSRIPHDEAVFGGAGMSSVTVGGPGLVAVGGSDSGAVVWTSIDGISWTRVPHDEAVFGGGVMWGVTAGGPALVAVGTTNVAGQAAAVWTSVDGISWTRVPHDESVFGGADNRQMLSVTVGGPGLVAVGDGLPLEGGPSYAVVWTSIDGISWTRVPHEASVFGGDRTMWNVTAGGPGLVAVGETHRPSRPEVWTSVSGITWSRVPHDETVFGRANMFAVIVGGPGLISVGVNESSVPFDAGVWVWED